MHTSVVSALLFAACAFSLPAEQKKSVVARTAPATPLLIRGWNVTDPTCNLDNIHALGFMGPNEDTWGNGGWYTTYSLSRALAANETLNLFASAGGNNCGTFLYSVPAGTANGCYELGDNQEFSCMQMGTPA
ncbi:hypothetical protein HO173_008650 [Letharia columbiana]|uniref:Uncharacterized protein n=1 Tax=Letharia columbiana TaxID=112416 RepID=A0A8H6FQX7_9LECA|nr:uncharacterized protein HO173_008650 [Letharia columbiana]KAF6233106.1 hypothetical protein HO173_008650 [Letharia columbiana]